MFRQGGQKCQGRKKREGEREGILREIS